MAAFRDDDEMEDKGAYNSLSNRPLNEDISAQGRADDAMESDDLSDFKDAPVAPSMPSGEAALSPRQATMNHLLQKTSVEDDPLMQDFQNSQNELKQNRSDQADSNFRMNLAQAFSQAAQGGNAPVQNDKLFSNIAEQNKVRSQAEEEDLKQRQRVIASIESRHWHEGTPGSLATKQQTANDRHDRLMSGLDSKIQSDEILKPAQINLESLNKSNRILNDSSITLTPQALKDAEMDITSALSLRPNSLTEGKIHRTEMNAMSLRIADLLQQYGNKPVDVRKIAPDLVAQVQKINNVLTDDYTDTINNRLTQRVNSQKTLISDPGAGGRLDKYLQQNLAKKRESNKGSFPKQVRNSKTGQMATVQNADELKEASSEGFQ